MKLIHQLKYMYRAHRFKHKIDSAEINYLTKNLHKSEIAIDIGAHKGGYLYWMRQRVGATGQIYAFEPQRTLFQYLEKTISLMNYQNVTLENQGISTEDGKLKFYIPNTKQGTSPAARIDFLENDISDYQEVMIKVTSLDTYFFDRQIFPNFLKIDVEGHEKNVLLGGSHLLEICKPRIIMECENRHLSDGETVLDVFEVLLKLNYRGYFFENQTLKPIEEFEIDKHQQIAEGRFWEAKNYVNNFIFEP